MYNKVEQPHPGFEDIAELGNRDVRNDSEIGDYNASVANANLTPSETLKEIRMAYSPHQCQRYLECSTWRFPSPEHRTKSSLDFRRPYDEQRCSTHIRKSSKCNFRTTSTITPENPLHNQADMLNYIACYVAYNPEAGLKRRLHSMAQAA